MFSCNHKISMRQVYRLFVFDLIGVSTLELPARLAYVSGNDGLLAILIGGVIASGYLWYLGRILSGMETDIVTYMEQALPIWLAKLIMIFLAFHAVCEAGFGAYIFSDVMKRGLIPEESYTLILVLILLVSAYAVHGGIESRARIYEILFWVLAVSLFFMFLVAFGDLDWEYVGPFFMSSASGVVQGGILEFLCYTPIFAILFFPAYVEKKKQKKLVGAVMVALWSAVLVLFVLYVILLGSFGSGALMQMEYPAVTLMSSIHLRSSFLKRFDSFMLAIWFFTLFAVISLFLFYGAKLLCAVFSPTKRKGAAGQWIALIGVTLLVFAVAELFYYLEWDQLFRNYLYYVGAPMLVLLPGFVLVVGKAGKRQSSDSI